MAVSLILSGTVIRTTEGQTYVCPTIVAGPKIRGIYMEMFNLSIYIFYQSHFGDSVFDASPSSLNLTIVFPRPLAQLKNLSKSINNFTV